MRTRITAAILCAASLAAVGYAFSGGPSPAAAPPVQTSQPRQSGAPDHVAYRMLLHHAYLLEQKAEDADREGRPDSARAFRAALRDLARLDERQAGVFARHAADCEREVSAQDARARVLIEARRAHYLATGKALPPSPELAAMQQERNQIILGCRDRLRESLGEREWARLDAFVRSEVAPRVTATTASADAAGLAPRAAGEED